MSASKNSPPSGGYFLPKIRFMNPVGFSFPWMRSSAWVILVGTGGLGTPAPALGTGTEGLGTPPPAPALVTGTGLLPSSNKSMMAPAVGLFVKSILGRQNALPSGQSHLTVT